MSSERRFTKAEIRRGLRHVLAPAAADQVLRLIERGSVDDDPAATPPVTPTPSAATKSAMERRLRRAGVLR